MRAFSVIMVGVVAAFGAPAAAADLRILDVKAYLFLERAGKLSDNVVGGPDLVNLPKGGGPDGDTATGVFIDFLFAGDRNSAPKYATATIDVTQTGKVGQPVVLHKAFANFIFGSTGLVHKALFLENATCASLDVDVQAGKTNKDVKLDFQCP